MANRARNPNQSSDVKKIASSLAVGAGLAYLMDPEKGHRRRVLIRDQAIKFSHRSRNAIDVTSRDLLHRGKGLLARIRTSLKNSVIRETTPDEVLIDRVRAKLGRYISHPHAVQITAENGRITLRGQALVEEIVPLIEALWRIPGVKEVINQLDSHRPEEQIASLQGGTRRRGEVIDALQTTWAPATRFLVGSSGIAFLILGLRRKDALGKFLGGSGLLSLLRATTNLEFTRIFGIPSEVGVTIHKTLHVHEPIEKVFSLWTDLSKYPNFLTSVREVRGSNGGNRFHWVVDGPFRLPISWNCFLTRWVPNELIAWRTSSDSFFGNSGRIRFQKVGEGSTQVDLDLCFDIPGGILGHRLSQLLGVDPKRKVEEGLYQMKTFIEQGPSKRQLFGLHGTAKAS